MSADADPQCCQYWPNGHAEDCPNMPGWPAPSATGEGTERPGGWVDGIGWVARLGDVADDDLIRHGEPTSDPARDARRWYTPTVLVEVARWADGSTPQPPVPPQGTERPDTAALLTIGDWLLRTLPGHQGAEQTAAALAYTARWIDAQPPVPPSPAPRVDSEVRDAPRDTWDGSCDECGMGNENVDQHADWCPWGVPLPAKLPKGITCGECGNTTATAEHVERLARYIIRNNPVEAVRWFEQAAAPPSAPVERPQPDEVSPDA